MKEPLAVALIAALVIIAVLVVPGGTISVSAVSTKGSYREETPKAAVSPPVQQPPQEASVG